MTIFCIYRIGAAPGSLPVRTCTSKDSARRFIKRAKSPHILVERRIRLEYGYSPENIIGEYRIEERHGVNYYERVQPFKVKSI